MLKIEVTLVPRNPAAPTQMKSWPGHLPGGSSPGRRGSEHSFLTTEHKTGIVKMSLHRRSTVFGACLIAGVMLVAGPISAAPLDYSLDVQEIGPQHSHITVRLRNTAHGNKPIDGAIVSIDAVEGPETLGAPTMTQSFVARPGPGTGRYTIIPEPGMQPFELLISAEVPGETEPVTADLLLSK
jgi:hypothetical protein